MSSTTHPHPLAETITDQMAAKLIEQLKHQRAKMHPMVPGGGNGPGGTGPGPGGGGGNGGGTQTYSLSINNPSTVWTHSGALPKVLTGTSTRGGQLSVDVEINAANSSGWVWSELVYLLKPTTSFTVALTALLQSITHTLSGNASITVGIQVDFLPNNGSTGHTLFATSSSLGNNTQTLTTQFSVNNSGTYAISVYCIGSAASNGAIAKAMFNVPSVTYTKH